MRESGVLSICLFSLSANTESVGRRCVPFLMEELGRSYACVQHFDLREFEPVWVDGRALCRYPSCYQRAFEAVASCAGVVFIVPVHCYAVSGAAKQMTEILADALTRKPVAILSAAGSTRSHLAIADLMKSMTFEQDTICYPKSVQWTAEDFDQSGSMAQALSDRLRTFASDFLDFCMALRPFSGSGPASHRAPGMFVELYIRDVAFHSALFTDVLGFERARQVGKWLDLRKDEQRVLLNWEDLEPSHPFFGCRQEERLGGGVETAFVVDDVPLAYRRCCKLAGGRLSTIERQPWGMTDFRITAPEGFYLRITSPAPL